MKTKTYNVYYFDELSKEAQEKALERYYDINVCYDDWYYSEPDYSIIDLKAFDLYRETIVIDFKESAEKTAQTILVEYGKHCKEYILSKSFLKEYKKALKNNKNNEYEDVCVNLENDYREELAQCYLDNLQQQYDYLTSGEAIKETFEANEYQFTIDGKID